MKQCTKCLATKNYSDFHKKTATRDGYAYHCKSCVREYDLKEHDPKRVYERKVVDGKIHCRWCMEYLDESEFGKTKTYCKNCANKVGHAYNLKRFNLSPEEYIDLSNSQNNVCKICGQADKTRLSIDHDHSCCPGANSCGRCIRGLLCSQCNKTLGLIRDDIKILQKMIEYLS